MGIKGFTAWLRSTFPQVFSSLPSARGGHRLLFDQVYIDLNPFIHLAARQTASREQVLAIVKRSIRHTLTYACRPKSFFCIAMDGAASMAKLKEQRSRRQDSAIEAVKRNCFDPQHITPGCTFMTMMEAELHGMILELMANFNNPKFSAVLDGAASAGEGEYKIIKRLLKDHINCDPMNGRVTRAILGLDADMFLQALLSEVPHLYLVDPFAQPGSETACFSVDRWRRALAACHGGDEEAARRVALDFSLIVLMNGSDYVPNLRYVNYKTMWASYLQQSSHLKDLFLVQPEGKTINLAALRSLCANYLQTMLADSLRPHLHTYHNELVADQSTERILTYCEHLIWNLEALITANTTDDPNMTGSECISPSLIELAEMNCEALQVMLDKRLKFRRNVKESKKQRLPGVIALMLLDWQSGCELYVPAALRPIVQEARDLNLTDAQLIDFFTKRIEAIDVNLLSLPDKLTIFPRPPILVNAQNAVSRNFFIVADSNSNRESGNDLENLPWQRPYVYLPSEEESWQCPLHASIFERYKNL